MKEGDIIARQPQVTRELKVTAVNAIVVNICDEKIERQSFELSRTYKNDNQILDKINKILKDSNYKAVSVVSAEEKSYVFCMTEDDFIKHAVKLEKRQSTLKGNN